MTKPKIITNSTNITTKEDQLLKSADNTIKAAQNPNTLRAYKSDFKLFAQFYFQIWKLEIFEKETFNLKRAITPSRLKIYIAHLNEIGKKYNTMLRKVAAISKLHKLQGLKSPRNEIINDYLKSIKIEQSDKGMHQQQAKAITASDLEKVIMKIIDVTTNKGKRDKAIILCCFVGCLRRSEVANICYKDGEHVPLYLEKDNDGYFIHINQSKRAKTKEENTSRFLPYSSNPLLCPIRALEAWLDASNIEEGPIFRSVSKGDKIKDTPICGQTVYTIIKKYFGDNFSGHSLRVGSAVTARLNGADMESIRILGGWKTDQQPRRYTQQTDIKRNSASFKLGL